MRCYCSVINRAHIPPSLSSFFLRIEVNAVTAKIEAPWGIRPQMTADTTKKSFQRDHPGHPDNSFSAPENIYNFGRFSEYENGRTMVSPRSPPTRFSALPSFRSSVHAKYETDFQAYDQSLLQKLDTRKPNPRNIIITKESEPIIGKDPKARQLDVPQYSQSRGAYQNSYSNYQVEDDTETRDISTPDQTVKSEPEQNFGVQNSDYIWDRKRKADLAHIKGELLDARMIKQEMPDQVFEVLREVASHTDQDVNETTVQKLDHLHSLYDERFISVREPDETAKQPSEMVLDKTPYTRQSGTKPSPTSSNFGSGITSRPEYHLKETPILNALQPESRQTSPRPQKQRPLHSRPTKIPHTQNADPADGAITRALTHFAVDTSSRPSEDLTNFSEMAERRRIQNRNAQRNYSELFIIQRQNYLCQADKQ